MFLASPLAIHVNLTSAHWHSLSPLLDKHALGDAVVRWRGLVGDIEQALGELKDKRGRDPMDELIDWKLCLCIRLR